MNLIIDIGNTLIKTSLFRGDECLNLSYFKNTDINELIQFIKIKKAEFPSLKKAIVSTVLKLNKELNDFLETNFEKFIDFNYRTKIPIKNLYNSPKTLGKDRLAGVIAANNIFSGRNVLVFDAGTALTVDFINKNGEYTGGAISPGLSMRFKALNDNTANLPLIKIDDDFMDDKGTDTETSIKSGVQKGILYETEGFITAYKRKYVDLTVIFTGGDTFFFEKRLKSKIFADPNLVSKGLNIILNYND